MTGLRLSLVVAVSVLGASTPATSAPSDGEAAIDKSTVRIFALGTVGIENVTGQRGSIKVADPKSGHGTGFIVGSGVVLTAAHVVDGARHIVVRLPNDGGFFAARVAHAETAADIAVLVFEPDRAKNHPRLVLSKDRAPRNRENVFAIGYPIDPSRTSAQSARGIVAGRLDDGTIQLDMALNPGNSGGPLVDDRDQVVGMVVARGAVEKGVQGIGYAVPVTRLHAAVAEAQRKRKGIKPLTASDHTSATVVDGMVQHGALHDLREAVDVRETAKTKLDEVLEDLVGRLDDPDLLVYVAAAMWNTAISLELADSQRLAQAHLTSARAREVAARLRESAVRSVTKATQQDPDVAQRSPFVSVALGDAQPSPPPETTLPNYQAAAFPGTLGAGATEVYEPVPMTPVMRTGIALRVTPEARWNPATASFGLGYGVGVDLRFTGARSRTSWLLGAGFGKVGVSTVGEEFSHSFLVADGGLAVRVGDRIELSGSAGIAYYSSTVSSTSPGPKGGASAAALTARLAAAYRIGVVHLGTAVRGFNGPTLWLEPLYMGLVF